MQKVLALIFALSFSALKGALGSPTPFAKTGGGWGDWHGRECVSDAQAAELVQNIQDLYHCLDPTLAEKVLTPDYVSYSYTLLRTPGGLVQDGNNVYASSRDDFIQKGLANNPTTCDDPPFVTYKIWNGCDIVAFWWSITPHDPTAPAPYEFVGLDVMEIDVASGRISADYSEFSY